MRFLLVLVVICIWLKPIYGQIRTCGTDILMQETLQRHPYQKQLLNRLEGLYVGNDTFAQSRSNDDCEVAIIPLVVHVVYSDDESNISDEQVLSQIEVLNQDYRRIHGTNGFGPGTDMRIQFCLAGKDPEGNPSSGITRTLSELSRHNSNKDQELKDLVRWDPSRYLNIWVVKDVEVNGQNSLGYTFLPGAVAREREGVVVDGNYFGTLGSVLSPFDQGRTTTHEVGHFLGLLHTFNSEGNCGDAALERCLEEGDRVCDTPFEKNPNYECERINTCADIPCDQIDPANNYLNYSPDACMNMFTKGQKERAWFFLSNFHSTLISEENLVSTGCVSEPVLGSKPRAAFEIESPVVCIGNTLQFQAVEEACIGEYNWVFEGGQPTQSSEPNPVVRYTNPGHYDVQLIVTNGSLKDTLVHRNLVQVATSQEGLSQFAQDFETGSLLATGWHLVDEDQAGSWLLTNLDASSGQFSVVLPKFWKEGLCSSDDFISPIINLDANQSAIFSFDYAYQQAKAGLPGERLEIAVSKDCGRTFDPPVFSKEGSELATVDGLNDDEAFFPNAPYQWQQALIRLDDYTGINGLRIRIRAIGQGGQHLYLDNIQFESVLTSLPVPFEKNVRLGPNPLKEKLNIYFELEQPRPITIEVRNLMGQLVYQTFIKSLPAGPQSLLLDDEKFLNIPDGLYHFALYAGKFVHKQILIKQ